MYLIGVPNLKKNRSMRRLFLAQSYCFKSVQNVKKIGQLSETTISRKLLSRFSPNLVCKVVYMEGIKYVNLIEIGPVAMRG